MPSAPQASPRWPLCWPASETARLSNEPLQYLPLLGSEPMPIELQLVGRPRLLRPVLASAALGPVTGQLTWLPQSGSAREPGWQTLHDA